MTVLQRTDLTTSQKIQCAAAAVAGQQTTDNTPTASRRSRPLSLSSLHRCGWRCRDDPRLRCLRSDEARLRVSRSDRHPLPAGSLCRLGRDESRSWNVDGAAPAHPDAGRIPCTSSPCAHVRSSTRPAGFLPMVAWSFHLWPDACFRTLRCRAFCAGTASVQCPMVSAGRSAIGARPTESLARWVKISN